MIAHGIIFGTFLAIAAAADVTQRRVPNMIVAPLAAAGVGAQWARGGAIGAGDGLLAGAVVLALLALPWARGIIGAGDVKLAAAAAIWLGLGLVVPFLLYAGAAGLPVALAVGVAGRVHSWRLARAARGGGGHVGGNEVTHATVPVAVAVAIGALAALWGKP